MFNGSVVSSMKRTRSRFSKSGAKVGIKRTSLEFRDSFGNDGTISGFSGFSGLKRDRNGNPKLYCCNTS